MLVCLNDMKLRLLLLHVPLRLYAKLWPITTRWCPLNWSIFYLLIGRINTKTWYRFCQCPPADCSLKVLPGNSIAPPGILKIQALPPTCTYMNDIRHAYVWPDTQKTLGYQTVTPTGRQPFLFKVPISPLFWSISIPHTLTNSSYIFNSTVKCWSTVFSELHSQRIHLPEHFRALHASFCWQAYTDADFIFQQDLPTLPNVPKAVWPEPHRESMGYCQEEDERHQYQQCRWREGCYQSNLGFHYTWEVPQADQFHATLY